jgi:hypothetical protein
MREEESERDPSPNPEVRPIGHSDASGIDDTDHLRRKQ